MIEEVEITEDIIIAAWKKGVEMGKLNRSILRGGGNLAGFIGEFVAADFYGAKVENTFEYDLVLPNGDTIDVKSKQTSVKPLEHYDCSIASSKTSKRQSCDYYVFVRVLNDFSKAWVLGWKSNEDYFNEARFLKKGTKDGDNKFTVRADCYNLEIKDLNQDKTIK